MIETLRLDSRIKFGKDEMAEHLITPKVIRVNQFTEEAVEKFSADMSEASQEGQEIIPIVIDTEGGDPYSLFAMVDLIESSEIPVATIVEGKAFSCGAVLFCCGAQGCRFMGPNSTLMIHDVMSCDENIKKTKEVVTDALETNRLNKKLYQIIDRGIGKPTGYTQAFVQKRGRSDWYLTPQQSLKLGYTNHISIPRVQCTVSVSTQLIF